MTSVPPAASALPPRLVLASASPRRQALLREAGYDFAIHPADIDEAALARGLLPFDLAMRLALAKSNAVAAKFPSDVVLGADTVVAFGDQVLGKPRDADNARAMLNLLSGTTHIVVTGIALVRLDPALSVCERVLSAVQMRLLTSAEIEAYVASNEWQGKAGGYGIQDQDPFVVRLGGCHTNIVGLPMTSTARVLRSAGILPAA